MPITHYSGADAAQLWTDINSERVSDAYTRGCDSIKAHAGDSTQTTPVFTLLDQVAGALRRDDWGGYDAAVFLAAEAFIALQTDLDVKLSAFLELLTTNLAIAGVTWKDDLTQILGRGADFNSKLSAVPRGTRNTLAQHLGRRIVGIADAAVGAQSAEAAVRAAYNAMATYRATATGSIARTLGSNAAKPERHLGSVFCAVLSLRGSLAGERERRAAEARRREEQEREEARRRAEIEAARRAEEARARRVNAARLRTDVTKTTAEEYDEHEKDENNRTDDQRARNDAWRATHKNYLDPAADELDALARYYVTRDMERNPKPFKTFDPEWADAGPKRAYYSYAGANTADGEFNGFKAFQKYYTGTWEQGTLRSLGIFDVAQSLFKDANERGYNIEDPEVQRRIVSIANYLGPSGYVGAAGYMRR